MQKLHSLGYHLLPCGGDNGKQPLRKRWNRPGLKRLPLQTVISVMLKANSSCYGIRLDGLAVVDCDTWNEETQAFLQLYIEPTEFLVRTPRGAHLYFRTGETMPGKFDADGVQVDFKAGHAHFVVGPGSTRSDGRHYDLERGDVTGVQEVVPFRFKAPLPSRDTVPKPRNRKIELAGLGSIVPTQAFTSTVVPEGGRNKAAFAHACLLARDTSDLDEVAAALSLWVKVHCARPETFADAEILKICRSALQLRAEGRLYGAACSEFRISRNAFSVIASQSRALAGNTWLLYSYLRAAHGHVAGRSFVIVAKAIADSGKLPLSKSTIDRCKQELRRLDLVRLFRKGRHLEPDRFVLTPISQIGSRTRETAK